MDARQKTQNAPDDPLSDREGQRDERQRHAPRQAAARMPAHRAGGDRVEASHSLVGLDSTGYNLLYPLPPRFVPT